MKQLLKNLAGLIRCFLKGIKYPQGGVYIGSGVSIVGGRNIRLSRGVSIRPDVDLWCGNGEIVIGSGTDIGTRSRISICNKLWIGNNVLFSPNVYITDCDHAYEDVTLPVMAQGAVKKENSILIGDDSYVGINSVIVGNVSIGKHVVIGANSVVTKDIPDYCVAVGSPARIIKQYHFDKQQWLKV